MKKLFAMYEPFVILPFVIATNQFHIRFTRFAIPYYDIQLKLFRIQCVYQVNKHRLINIIKILTLSANKVANYTTQLKIG